MCLNLASKWSCPRDREAFPLIVSVTDLTAGFDCGEIRCITLDPLDLRSKLPAGCPRICAIAPAMLEGSACPLGPFDNVSRDFIDSVAVDLVFISNPLRNGPTLEL